MPIGASKVTRRNKARRPSAEVRSGDGGPATGPDTYGRAENISTGKKPEPSSAPAKGYIQKRT